ncbi:hypothetical protein CVT24_001875 [Panaeolus cyanescens]|uniref:Uncharacterized protein n=1 Tax=Panaeolus cyanescens TaxID=181874 RepID=A0A409YEQ2_9AGAR|nr:hypothetical protein CVT24_001875 [Panaeolus cyanescens]
MEIDNTADWESCTASTSSLASSIYHGTPKSDTVDLLFCKDASDSDISSLSTRSSTLSSPSLEVHQILGDSPCCPCSAKSLDTLGLRHASHVQLRALIKSVVTDLALGTSEECPGVDPILSQTMNSLPMGTLSSDIVLIVKLTLEAFQQELRKHSNSPPFDAAKAMKQSEPLPLEQMEQWPVGEFLRAVLCNPWADAPFGEYLDIERTIFDTTHRQYTSFSPIVEETTMDNESPGDTPHDEPRNDIALSPSGAQDSEATPLPAGFHRWSDGSLKPMPSYLQHYLPYTIEEREYYPDSKPQKPYPPKRRRSRFGFIVMFIIMLSLFFTWSMWFCLTHDVFTALNTPGPVVMPHPTVMPQSYYNRRDLAHVFSSAWGRVWGNCASAMAGFAFASVWKGVWAGFSAASVHSVVVPLQEVITRWSSTVVQVFVH